MSNIITYKNQQINNDVWNFSEFQIEYAKRIESQPDFKKWCSIDMSTSNSTLDGFVRKKGPVVFLWTVITTGNIFRTKVMRVGVNRTLTDVVTSS